MQSWQCNIPVGKCWENLFKLCCRVPLFIFSSIDCNWSQSVVVSCSLEAEWAHIHSTVPSLTQEHSRHLESHCDSNRTFQRLCSTGHPLASIHWPSGNNSVCSLLAFHYSSMHCRATWLYILRLDHWKTETERETGVYSTEERTQDFPWMSTEFTWRSGCTMACTLCHSLNI